MPTPSGWCSVLLLRVIVLPVAKDWGLRSLRIAATTSLWTRPVPAKTSATTAAPTWW